MSRAFADCVQHHERCLALPIVALASRQLAWLSLAMFLGMTLWFSATAANAAIVAEFHLAGATTAPGAWLAVSRIDANQDSPIS